MLTYLFLRFPRRRLAHRERIRARRQRHVDVHDWLCPSCDIWDDDEIGHRPTGRLAGSS
jgi:hypothetical protein